MKYDNDSALSEITRRKNVLIRDHKRKKIAELTAATAVVGLMLVLSFMNMDRITGIDEMYSVYGSFLLSDSVGGYVLVGVICFAAAVIITLLCLRKNNNKDRRLSGDEQDSTL